MKVRKKYGFFMMDQNRVLKSQKCCLSSGNYYNISQRKHVWTFLNIDFKTPLNSLEGGEISA